MQYNNAQCTKNMKRHQPAQPQQPEQSRINVQVLLTANSMWKWTAVLFTTLLLAVVEGHNRLLSPMPWSPFPIKVQPCGGGFRISKPLAYWQVGSVQNITWTSIGDGLGNVTVSLDPEGGSNFTVQLDVFVVDVLGAFNYSIKVPKIACRNGVCSLQVASTSGWFECTSLAIVPPCQNCPSPALNSSCLLAQNLSYCSSKNGVKVQIVDGFLLKNIDEMTRWGVNAYLNMTTIFSRRSNEDCIHTYHEYMCDSLFPPCGAKSGICRTECEQLASTCGLLPGHAELYDCAVLPPCSAKLM